MLASKQSGLGLGVRSQDKRVWGWEVITCVENFQAVKVILWFTTGLGHEKAGWSCWW